MDQCGGFNPVQYNVQGSADTRAQAHPISRLAQPYILDPDLGAMYSAPSLDHPSFPTYTEPSTSSYSPTPSEMAITPDSSDFPSPADSAFSPFIMDIPTPTSSAPEPVAKKPSHSKKRPAGHIPRPRNAFILFRSHHVAAQLIPGKVENDHRHISKIIGEIWNKLSPAERLIWEQKADIEKERHSRKYPGYRYKPAKLDGVVKRRVKCRGAPALSAYSSSPGIGKANGAQEIIGSLNVAEGGVLSFGNSERPRLIDQEERRKDKARCVRVAQLIQQGVVGKHLEEEAQRLGLDRDSVTSATPQLQPSAHETPGTRCQFHTNVDILRVLEEENPVFTDPFAPNNPSIPRPDVMHPLNSGATGSVITNYSPTHTFTSLAGSDENSVLPTTVSPPSQVNDSLRGWSYRRASSLPLILPLHYLRYLPNTPIQLPTLTNDRKQTIGRDSDSSLSAFDRLSYYSPGNSPPEQHLTPHIHPRLHFKNTTSRSNLSSVNPISHINSTPTLYGINSTRPWRSEEPIDLSAMYEQDNATGNEATLHSTYAINTGKAYPPIPTAPAPLGDVPISHQLALSCKSAHNHTASEFDVEPGPSQSYYDWPSQYGSELNYPPVDDYNASANPEIYKEVPNMYYSNTTGDLPY
ncbi:high mobility group [Rhizoctonia solani]|uniref:High mobility group n=1 Tax=Rhizoctonia solani TaxID=456999 RepID=A0A8H7I9F0_9AGAM|nr:high mobility group [Rhizoctonia solani]